MFIHYRTNGVMIKKKDLGEADQLFTIYTKDFGKLEILGKAIRKISSKLRSGAELFYLFHIVRNEDGGDVFVLFKFLHFGKTFGLKGSITDG